MSDTLDPIEPSDAVEMYLGERSTEVSDATLQAHEYRLSHFLRWCDEQDIDDMNGLTGRSLHRYKLWRRDDGDLKQVSLKSQIDTIRVFIRFCETIDAVETDLHTKVLSPSLEDAETQRDVKLEAETAVELLGYLRRFHYASFDHVLLQLLWHTGARTGSVQALDVEDYDPEKEYLKVQHRPETPLKNKSDGERLIALSGETCTVLDDWIAYNRSEVVDDAGRDALLTTSHGRAHKTTIRETVYRWTRPCQYGQGCPHERDIEDCEATDERNKTASKCPSSVSPHAIRRGSITHFLTEDVPEKVVSDRMNVSPEILDKHYDRRSEEVKVEQRRGYLEDI